MDFIQTIAPLIVSGIIIGYVLVAKHIQNKLNNPKNKDNGNN